MDRYNIFNYTIGELIIIFAALCGLLVWFLVARIEIENFFSEPNQRKSPKLITQNEKNLIDEYRRLDSAKQEEVLRTLSNICDS